MLRSSNLHCRIDVDGRRDRERGLNDGACRADGSFYGASGLALCRSFPITHAQGRADVFPEGLDALEASGFVEAYGSRLAFSRFQDDPPSPQIGLFALQPVEQRSSVPSTARGGAHVHSPDLHNSGPNDADRVVTSNGAYANGIMEIEDASPARLSFFLQFSAGGMVVLSVDVKSTGTVGYHRSIVEATELVADIGDYTGQSATDFFQSTDEYVNGVWTQLNIGEAGTPRYTRTYTP